MIRPRSIGTCPWLFPGAHLGRASLHASFTCPRCASRGSGIALSGHRLALRDSGSLGLEAGCLWQGGTAPTAAHRPGRLSLPCRALAGATETWTSSVSLAQSLPSHVIAPILHQRVCSRMGICASRATLRPGCSRITWRAAMDCDKLPDGVTCSLAARVIAGASFNPHWIQTFERFGL